MSDKAKRDAVLVRYKFLRYYFPDHEALADRIVELEAEIDRLRRILAALREPSAAVLTAAHQPLKGIVPAYLVPVIRAAVAAAEQEVAHANQ